MLKGVTAVALLMRMPLMLPSTAIFYIDVKSIAAPQDPAFKNHYCIKWMVESVTCQRLYEKLISNPQNSQYHISDHYLKISFSVNQQGLKNVKSLCHFEP